jgi:hypothetical protein
MHQPASFGRTAVNGDDWMDDKVTFEADAHLCNHAFEYRYYLLFSSRHALGKVDNDCI